jgi:hypothetical protein
VECGILKIVCQTDEKEMTQKMLKAKRKEKGQK